MEIDTEKTYVSFAWEQENSDNNKEIVAFFAPTYYESYGLEYTCYVHVGQHGAYSMEYARGCKEAKPEEYQDLFNELTDIGYNLQVVKLSTLKNYTEHVALK